MKQTEMKQTSGWLSVMIIWKCIKQTIACVTVEEWTVGPLHWGLCARAFRIVHVISIFLASQLHFLANRNPELADGSQ